MNTYGIRNNHMEVFRLSKKIPVSFKENDEDMKLFLEIKNQSDQSAYVKEALKFYLKYRYLAPYLDQLDHQERMMAITGKTNNKFTWIKVYY